MRGAHCVRRRADVVWRHIADSRGTGAYVRSLVFAVTALGDLTFYPKLTHQQIEWGGIQVAVFPYARWASAFVVLLVLLTIVGFARQMAREHRSHLVRALSHSLTSGVAAASMAGWTFLPRLFGQLHGDAGSQLNVIGMVAVLACAVILMIALGVGSLLWWLQSDPDERIQAPWVGFALMPVLISGLLVYGAGLGVLLVKG